MKKKKRPSASPEMGIFKNFLANHLTAAGVAYVVTSRSIWKRWAWFVALWAIFLGMSFMTFQVVQEYLRYPINLKTERKQSSSLVFPAVTICGLNIIPRPNAKPAGLQYLEDMKNHMYELPTYEVPADEKKRCRDDPMCHWSWTYNKCSCVASPCETALCFPFDEDDDSDVCLCSMLICRRNDTAMIDACDLSYDDPHSSMKSDSKTKEPLCICNKTFVYSRATNITKRTHPPAPIFDDDEAVNKRNSNDCNFDDEIESEGCLLRQALISHGMKKKEAELIYRIKTALRDDLQDIERLYMPPLKITNDFGNTFDNVILSCNFGPGTCTKKNFTTLFSPRYGKCYMFNHVGSDEDEKPIEVRHAGQNYGLQLYLQSRDSDSIDLLNPQLGMRIIVHDPRMLPFGAEYGIDIKPGDMSNVDIELVKTSRLGPPWGKCVADGSYRYNDGPYNQISCERNCLNNKVMSRCGCYHTMFLTGTTIPRMKRRVCDTILRQKDDLCFMEILEARETGKIDCKCPPPCEEYSYTTGMSTGRVNRDFFRLVQSAKSMKILNGTPHIPRFHDQFEILGLRVFYRTMSYITVTDTESYSWQSLVANIGGNMGLFLGLSLVTFLEIFEFFTDVIYALFVAKKKNPPRRPVSTIYPKEHFNIKRKKCDYF